METVIFNSDIAQMVLGYLRKQRLDKAAEMFCKTSPFLEKEYEVLKQGYRLFGFKEDLLETIIREYCKITTKVDKAIETLPQSLRENLHQKSLSSKVSSLINHHTNATIIENKENNSNSKKRKRTSTSSIDCDVKFTNDEDMMRPPTSISKRPRLSRGGPNSKNSNAKDFDILSQSEVCDLDSCDGDDDADDDEADRDFNLGAVKNSTSTPRLANSSFDDDLAVTSIPLENISQALLDNQEFHEKLASNINKALQTSTTQPTVPAAEKENTTLINELESVVKHATEATEIDPIFDEFLKRVVSSQVYPPDSLNQEEPPQIAEDASQPPSAPAVAPPLTNNSSFGSLIDPNFSVSKLIVLNSNESAQKNQQNDPIMTTAADGSQIINASTLDNQMYFDHATGQLTCPLLLTSDGMLNLPFLINSELIQQLQGDINLETSRIEIPLPEPIVLSVDQFPPNAVILRSTQKVDDPPKAITTVQDATIKPAQSGTTPASGIVNTRRVKSLSTPRKKSHVRTLSFSPMPNSKQILKGLVPDATIPEDPEPDVNKNVEIVSQIEVIPELDSENSNSISNQTVIHKELTDTPKRKEISKRVKRVLSKDHDQDHEIVQSSSANKTADEEQQPKKLTISQIDLTEWKRMRETSQTNFECYLREVNSRVDTPGKRDLPRKKTRKIPPRLKAAQAAKAAAKARQLLAAQVKKATKEQKAKKEPAPVKAPKRARSARKAKSKDETPFKIKIPTPHKSDGPSATSSSGKRSAKKDKESQPKLTENVTAQSTTTVKTEKVVFTQPEAHPHVKLVEERGKRTANIACLLDTPFKSPSDQLVLPKTPGLIPSSLDTPGFKMIDPLRNVSGAKNSNIPTPQYAITPGCSLTPFLNQTTPQSGSHHITTDYSSGGSYYRPDESDDLDKIIDKKLRETSTQKKKEPVPDVTPCKVDTAVVVVEEKIPCEPVVLSRVKSFADADEVPQVPVDLHYTLAAGLPELSYEEEEELRTSALSTSSSSSSSSSSSCSSSSSSSSSSCSSRSPSPEAKPADVKLNSLASLENLSEISSTEDDDWSKDIPLEKAAENPLVVNSQLVSEEWEVRYPVRSWLTPKKIDPSCVASEESANKKRQKQLSELELKKQRIKAKLSQIKNPTPVRPACLPTSTTTTKIPRSAKKSIIQTAKSKVTTIRKQYVMSTVTTKEKKVMKVMTPLKITDVVNSSPPSNEQLDVLTALNLHSAKKQTPEGKGKALTTRKVPPPKKKPQMAIPKEPAATKLKPKTSSKGQPTGIKRTPPKPTPRTKGMQKMSPPKGGSNTRKSSRPVKTPKALDNFATAPKKPPPTSKKSLKKTPSPQTAKKRKPELNLDPMVVLEPLSIAKEHETQQQQEKPRLLPLPPPPKEEIEETIHETEMIKLDSLKSSPETLKSIDSAPPCHTDNIVNNNDADDDDDLEDEDDPYELCERVLIDENDTKRFRCFTYAGPDGAPNVQMSPQKSHELNIFLNPNEKHCVKASAEFLLFSCEPRTVKTPSVRNIPKKRQKEKFVDSFKDAEISSSTNERLTNEKEEAITSPRRTSGGKQFNSPPSLTSTPVVPPLKISLLQKAAATRDMKKTDEVPNSSNVSTSRLKHDKKSSPTTTQVQNQKERSSESLLSPLKTISKEQTNHLEESNKSSPESKVTSTNPSEPAAVAEKDSTELRIDIDVILSKLHG